jgi:hypothetical protein
LDREELKVWLGITLYMGIAGMPQISDYWSSIAIWAPLSARMCQA